MTREQTVDLIHSIASLYPNWKPDNLTETVNAWCWALADYTAEQVKAALIIYMKTSNAGFAPSAAQLIGCINRPQENEYMTDGEAWALVKRAIQDGIYHSAERFNELPPLIQQAVGNANMIRQWAMSETEDVNTVIASNFARSYRAVVERQKFNDKVPPAIADVVRGITDKLDKKAIDIIK